MQRHDDRRRQGLADLVLELAESFGDAGTQTQLEDGDAGNVDPQRLQRFRRHERHSAHHQVTARQLFVLEARADGPGGADAQDEDMLGPRSLPVRARAMPVPLPALFRHGNQRIAGAVAGLGFGMVAARPLCTRPRARRR